MTEILPQYVVDAVTTIPLQRLRVGTKELETTYPAVYLGTSADRLTWGLTRDWFRSPDQRARWAELGHGDLVAGLDDIFSHFSYRFDSAEDIRDSLHRVLTKPSPVTGWWYFDAGTTCPGLRVHIDDLERALRELEVLR